MTKYCIVSALFLLFSVLVKSQTPEMVKDIAPGSTWSKPADFQEFNGNLIFVTSETNTGFMKSLWKSDGTESGTLKIKEINSTDSNLYHPITRFPVMNGKI